MRSNELCYQLKPSLTHQEIKIIREKGPEAESPYFLTHNRVLSNIRQ